MDPTRPVRHLAFLQAVPVLLVLRASPASMRISAPGAPGFASCRVAPAVLETSWASA